MVVQVLIMGVASEQGLVGRSPTVPTVRDGRAPSKGQVSAKDQDMKVF